MVVFKKIAYSQKYHDDNAIHDVIGYILRDDKAIHHFAGGYYVDPYDIAGSMVNLSINFDNYSRIRLHHFILSFDNSQPFKMKDLISIAENICKIIGERYQIVYAIHEDTDHLHIHFVFNAVSYIDGKKYRGGKGDYFALIGLCRDITECYGLYPLIHMNYTPSPMDTNKKEAYQKKENIHE